jgi:flagellar biosynthesis GTPase FlhF
MLSDAAERDVHRFIEELERRLSLQEKAAEEKQKETEPSRGDIFQNDDGEWEVRFRGANPFRQGQRVKLGRNRSTPANELVPSWKPLRVARTWKSFCILDGDLSKSFVEESSSVWVYAWVVADEAWMLREALTGFKESAPQVFRELIGAHTTFLQRQQQHVFVPVQEQEFEDVTRQLNSSQRQAVRRSLTSPLSLIQGPPGTGKTTVITVLAAYFAKRKKKLMAGGPSHFAVDNLVRAFVKTKVSDKLVRLGNVSDIAKDLHNYNPRQSLIDLYNYSRKKQKLGQICADGGRQC